MTEQYLLRGNRQGFDLSGLTRTDKLDGYSDFRRADGTMQTVVMTCFLTPNTVAGAAL